MTSFYEPQSEALVNLPLAFFLFIATAHYQSANTHFNIISDFYSPGSLAATNSSISYYEEFDVYASRILELRILREFANKIVSRSIEPSDQAKELLHKQFWNLI